MQHNQVDLTTIPGILKKQRVTHTAPYEIKNQWLIGTINGWLWLMGLGLGLDVFVLYTVTLNQSVSYHYDPKYLSLIHI